MICHYVFRPEYYYNWEAEIDLPDTVLPTFDGKNAKYKWRVMASLVIRGNDPDTG